GAGGGGVLLVERTEGGDGKVMIADFSSGQVPANVVYWEDWREHPLLVAWPKLIHSQLVGDFMGAGHAQVLFVNRTDGGDGKVMIADFSSGQVPSNVVYWEDWGEHPLLDGWLDDNDLQLVGDFMGAGHAQVLFVNRTD